MKRIPGWILISILFSLLLAACSPAPSPTAQTEPTPPQDTSQDDSSTSDTGSGYPGPDSGDSAYPTGEGTTNFLDEFDLVNAEPSVPSNGNGALTGFLLREGDLTPYASMEVFLGILLKDQNGNDVMARVDPSSAPRSQVDLNGYFVFEGVEPGRYILVVRLPPNNLVKLNDPVSGVSMFIDIEPNQVFELGQLEYDFIFGSFQPPSEE